MVRRLIWSIAWIGSPLLLPPPDRIWTCSPALHWSRPTHHAPTVPLDRRNGHRWSASAHQMRIFHPGATLFISIPFVRVSVIQMVLPFAVSFRDRGSWSSVTCTGGSVSGCKRGRWSREARRDTVSGGGLTIVLIWYASLVVVVRVMCLRPGRRRLAVHHDRTGFWRRRAHSCIRQ